MLEQQPSRTALAAAAHRAAHQMLEEGRVFMDPLALRILGRLPEDVAREAADRASPTMRLFVAARSALAESTLREGVRARGVGQVVVLGAGLDTFAYRHDLGERVRVFEVDHPATQAWKRRRLAEASIAAPASLVFAPVDFERESLADALAAAGFDPARRSFFVWLGVTPYLTREAVMSTLRTIASLPGGGEVVFDYAEPRERLPEAMRARRDERAARVAALGEPFLSAFEPEVLHADLEALGFPVVEDLGAADLVRSRLGLGSAPARGPPSAHVLYAATPEPR